MLKQQVHWKGWGNWNVLKQQETLEGKRCRMRPGEITLNSLAYWCGGTSIAKIIASTQDIGNVAEEEKVILNSRYWHDGTVHSNSKPAKTNLLL